MKKVFVFGALILGYSNLLFTACVPLNNALTSIDQGERKELLDFLSFLDTTIKNSGSASMEVMVDNQKATCGPMLAAITQKINKYQLLSSDEVEYGHAIAGALLRLHMPFFCVKRKTETTKDYEQLHTICGQLHAQTIIAEKPRLLSLFEKPANSYVSCDIERSPSAKVVNFLWEILN